MTQAIHEIRMSWILQVQGESGEWIKVCDVPDDYMEALLITLESWFDDTNNS